MEWQNATPNGIVNHHFMDGLALDFARNYASAVHGLTVDFLQNPLREIRLTMQLLKAQWVETAMSREFLSSAEHIRRGSGFHYFSVAVIALSFLALNAAHAQTTSYVLGTTNLLVGPAVGTNSVVLGVTPVSAAWTNAANANWLHLAPANQSGTGSTNIIFSYDANSGATRTGTLTLGSQSLTVTQVDSNYVISGLITGLINYVCCGSGYLEQPQSVALDNEGNVYVADSGAGNITEWFPSNYNNATILAIPGVGDPTSVAVDGSDNLYIANGPSILKRTAANSNVTTLVSWASDYPQGVALDGAGNVYVATVTGTIQKWTAVSSNLTTLVVTGLDQPGGLAVDAAGNVYIADTGNNAIKEWSMANNKTTTLVSSGLNEPEGVTVDGSGNVYIADTGNRSIKEWSAVNNTVTTLVQNQPGFFLECVAVDGKGNVYFGDTAVRSTILEIPNAFVNSAPRLENAAGGNDSLPPIEPPTENLLPPFAPTSDVSWLTITGITNGVVSFSVATNFGLPRIGFITLLGQTIPIVQVSSRTPLDLICVPIGGTGLFQLAFGSPQSGLFTVLSTTNVFLPMKDWAAIGTASNLGPNLFEFTDPNPATNFQRYYRVRSP